MKVNQDPVRNMLLLVVMGVSVQSLFAEEERTTYRHFSAVDKDGKVTEIVPVPSTKLPLWARDVSQEHFDWKKQSGKQPFFARPIPFVLPPTDEGETFYKHNHQPAITWLQNGDLLAIWYSTRSEWGTVLTVLASRLRPEKKAWDPSSEFFKAPDRNMHGCSIFHDGHGTIYHFNGMGPKGTQGWKKLALMMRSSNDNGVTWTPPKAIDDRLIARHQVISGTLMTKDGALIQNCDAVSGGNGGTALHISRDRGKTWTDPGEGKPGPTFTEGGKGEGTIAGIHAKVVELGDGRLLAFGRGDTIDGRMPMSISADVGKTWTYKAGPFPPISGGQRLLLKRLREGPLLFVSFTSGRTKPEANGMTFTDQKGEKFTGHGMYAAVSFDDGKTWPVRKLLTPGEGEFDGGAWTKQFTATPTRAEHAGYLAATQTPDGIIHLISSRLHYRFNLPWLVAGVSRADAKPSGEAADKNATTAKTPDDVLTLDLGKGVTMKLALVPAGKFMMGSKVSAAETAKIYASKEERFADEHPRHEVTISRPFYIGIHEVTQAQWKAVMDTEPWKEKVCVKTGDSYAASWMDWNEANEFCEKLAKKTGRKVALPTEAQWEYACRAGTETVYCFGNDRSKLGDYA